MRIAAYIVLIALGYADIGLSTIVKSNRIAWALAILGSTLIVVFSFLLGSELKQ